MILLLHVKQNKTKLSKKCHYSAPLPFVLLPECARKSRELLLAVYVAVGATLSSFLLSRGFVPPTPPLSCHAHFCLHPPCCTLRVGPTSSPISWGSYSIHIALTKKRAQHASKRRHIHLHACAASSYFKFRIQI